MRAKDLINYMIPPLKLEDDLDKAVKWMEELRLSELPVVDQGKFLGILTSDNYYLEEREPNNRVINIPLDASQSIVPTTVHFFEVLRVAFVNRSKLIAVEESGVYQGVIATEDIIEAFAIMSSLQSSGAVLVLEIEHRDYSLSDISRMIENEGAKILSSMIEETSPEDPLRLILKLNRENVSHIKSALNSRGYNVVEAFEQSREEETINDRLDMFLKYLNP